MYRLQESVPELHGKLQLRSGQRGTCHAEAHQLCRFRSSQDTTVAMITIGNRVDANDWMTVVDFNGKYSKIRNSRAHSFSARLPLPERSRCMNSNVWHSFHALAHSIIGNSQTAIPLKTCQRFCLDLKDCSCVVPHWGTDAVKLISLRYSVLPSLVGTY